MNELMNESKQARAMSVNAEEANKAARTPKKPLPKRRFNTRLWLRSLSASLLIVIALLFGSALGFVAQTVALQKEKVNKIDPGTIITSLFGQKLDHKINILLLGTDYNYVGGKRVSDQEAGTRSRTDTIMLASLDPDTHKVNILSIPRDTHVLIPGYQYDKINAAMTYGGVDLAKKTVTELTGVPIDYYMALKVDGLVNTVDILGGIKIYVEKDMKYQDDTAHLGINIHKGWKDHMNGQQAHGYIRFRHDELGDIGRVQRQQKFMRAVLEKLLEPASMLKFPQLLDHVNENIETDIPREMFSEMIGFGISLKKDDLHMVMLPGTFDSSTGVSYWAMDPYMARNVITGLFPESTLTPNTEAEPSASSSPSARPFAKYRLTVWNGTDDIAAGEEVVKRLREAGWTVWAVAKAPSGAPRTRFIAQTGKSELLPELGKAIGFPAGENYTASIGDISTDFTVLIEDDLVKVINKELKARQAASASPKLGSHP